MIAEAPLAVVMEKPLVSSWPLRMTMTLSPVSVTLPVSCTSPQKVLFPSVKVPESRLLDGSGGPFLPGLWG